MVKRINILTKIISGLLLLASGYLFFLLHKSTLLQLIIPSKLFSHLFTEKQYQIMFTIFLLSVISFIIQFIYLFKQSKNIFSHVGLSILAFIFTLSTYFAITNYFSCDSYFQFCKNGWHYEKNFLGQKVDVHYKVDLSGKRINSGGVGCGFYDDTPRNWDRLVMSLPKVKKIDESEDRILYELDNGTIGQINKNKKPYADDILTFAVSDIMFKGTSCETIVPLNQEPRETKLYDSLRIKTIFTTSNWTSFEHTENKNDYAFTFEYPVYWSLNGNIFSDASGKKVAELSPGVVLLKPDQKCFDNQGPGTGSTDVISKTPIIIGSYQGILEIDKIVGGLSNWTGVWYCLVNKDKAFLITFYEYEKIPNNTFIYEKILSTLKFYPVNQ